MVSKDFVPKSNTEMQQWYLHIEQVLRGQAKSFKDVSNESIDRLFLADGFATIRMREFPRHISLPEAQSLEDILRQVGISRDWIFSIYKVKRYGEMYEIEMKYILDNIQQLSNSYKKSLEPKNEKGQTLQEAMTEEIKRLEDGLPKSFLNIESSKEHVEVS
jgi:hypothetical protein